jgi:alpha-beta hydrolase superfamily lysophospholipase
MEVEATRGERPEIELLNCRFDTDDGSPIHADLRSPHPGVSLPLVIVCHGFLGYKRWGFYPYLSERLASADMHVMTMSFSKCGVDEETGFITATKAFATNSVGREIDDLQRVCTRVREGALPVPVQNGYWGLFGHSRGGAITMLVAPGFPEVRTVVTWSTPSRFDRYTERRKVKWKQEGALVFKDSRSTVPLSLDYSYYEDIAKNRKRYDLLRGAATLGIPHLMVHGERDTAVTLTETRALLGVSHAAERRLEVVSGCGHTFGVTHPLREIPPTLERAAELTVAWFDEKLKTKTGTGAGER